MLSGCVVFVCVAVLTLHGVRTQAAAPCSNNVSRTMEFSLTSHKDKTGRWVAEVNMTHSTDDHAPSSWKIDIQHNTIDCSGSSKIKLTAKVTAPPPAPKPGPGYELHRGGYYKFHSDKKTWPEAKTACESEGGHLAIINSEAESQVLKAIFDLTPTNVTGEWTLVGFHDRYKEGEYLTVFEEPLNATGFTRWFAPGQPDNQGGSATTPGEDCGTIHRSNAGLNDGSCA